MLLAHPIRMDAMQLKARAAFRRRPEACCVALPLLPCVAMQRQAQSWVKKVMPKSVHPRSALALLCRASQMCSKASGAISVGAKKSREQ